VKKELNKSSVLRCDLHDSTVGMGTGTGGRRIEYASNE